MKQLVLLLRKVVLVCCFLVPLLGCNTGTTSVDAGNVVAKEHEPVRHWHKCGDDEMMPCEYETEQESWFIVIQEQYPPEGHAPETRRYEVTQEQWDTLDIGSYWEVP